MIELVESLVNDSFSFIIRSLGYIFCYLLLLHTYYNTLKHDLISLFDISAILFRTYVFIII